MTSKNILGLGLILCFFGPLLSSNSLAWDGPPQALGGGISNFLKPTSYLDGNFQQLYGQTPVDYTNLRGNFVLYEGDRDVVQGSFKAQNLHLGQDYPLINTGALVPNNLWTLEAGGTFNHKLDSGDTYGVIVSGGSDSDVPFNSIHELALNVTATYVHPKDPLHSWIFFLNYSTDRSFAPGVPLPGLGYLAIDPVNHIQIFYGVPFFFGWQPTPDWHLKFTYFIPTLIDAEISRRLFADVKAHIDFDWVPQSWERAGRTDDNSRIILDQKKASLGISSPIDSRFFADFSGGYLFDQKIFEAESLFSSGISKTDIPAGGFARFDLAYKL